MFIPAAHSLPNTHILRTTLRLDVFKEPAQTIFKINL